MFSLYRTIAGVSIPALLCVIEDVQIPGSLDVTIQATSSEDVLEWLGPGASVSFSSGGTAYAFPLSGSDFLTAVAGTLQITVTEDLDFGVYEARLVQTRHIPGVSGFGLLGLIQGGNDIEARQALPLLIRIQSLQGLTQETSIPENPPAKVVLT